MLQLDFLSNSPRNALLYVKEEKVIFPVRNTSPNAKISLKLRVRVCFATLSSKRKTMSGKICARRSIELAFYGNEKKTASVEPPVMKENRKKMLQHTLAISALFATNTVAVDLIMV